MFEFIRKIFGTRQDRALAALQKQVAGIKKVHEKIKGLSHDELRAASARIKGEIRGELQGEEDTIAALKREAEESTDLPRQIRLFDEADAREKQLILRREKILNMYLPEVFAIVKETAYRFSVHEELIVTATDRDRELAERYPHITLKGDKAHYSQTWEVAGHEKKWSDVHYDVQLIGGIVLHEGRIAEMGTGEGKTLVATLPAFLNGLTGKGVHVVTVNDYLAKRDAEWMGPLYYFHGLTVDCIERHESHSPERKQAYASDITYGTNGEFGFDYLRDNMAQRAEDQVQRKLVYAIVDEIDQVLLDDAKTPLIISGPAKKSGSKDYKKLKPKIQRLYNAQKTLVAQLLQEAKKKITAGQTEEGGLSLFRVYRGLPKDPQLITYLSQKGIKQILSQTEDFYLQENKKMMPEADEPLFFTIDHDFDTIHLTEKGIEYLTALERDEDFFVLPNIATQLAEIENDAELSVDEKVAKKHQINEDFGVKSNRLHAVNQLLKAYALFHKEVEYVVIGGKIKLVDERTGRILEGRRYSKGLNEAIEAKENLEVQRATETYASITSQNYFRMYEKLSGMTGTAATEAAEFWDIYRLEVISIPPNKPIRRRSLNDRIYKTQHEKYNAIAQEVEEIKKTGRPILIITPSVEVSEYLRKKLQVHPSKVLNAKNHHLEADIIAQAGQTGSVTIATLMAGRGTDIKLSAKALAAGGLYVIIVEKHEIRRVNKQAEGRSGRQGDPGSTRCYSSLEDPLMLHFKHGYMGSKVDSIFEEEGEALEHDYITRAIEGVQKTKEQNQFSARKRALDYDEVLGKQREIIYKKRNHALHGNRLSLDIKYMIYSTVEEILQRNAHNPKALQVELMDLCHINYVTEERSVQVTSQKTQALYEKVVAQKDKSEKKLMEAFGQEELMTLAKNVEKMLMHVNVANKPQQVLLNVPSTAKEIVPAMRKAIEKAIVLKVLDQYWQEHLEAMSDLKSLVRHASYENKDPLLVYKFEAIKYFKHLLHKINTTCTQQMTALAPSDKGHMIMKEEEAVAQPSMRQGFTTSMDREEGEANPSRVPVEVGRTIGRNERVAVQYGDGTVKKEVKYKTVLQDLEAGKCVLLTS